MNCTIGVAKKGADQLRGYHEADLRLSFRLCRLLVFPRGGSFTVYFNGAMLVSDLEFSVDHKILLLKLTILSSETIDLRSQK